MSLETKDVRYQSVLVVDDDPFSLDVAQITLEQLGLTGIVTAADGQAGIRAYDRMPTPPDLILCDLYMPDADGIEFITSLGDRRYGGALVMVTGGDQSMMQMAIQLAQKAYGLQVLGALSKPLLPETLAHVLGLPLPPAAPARGPA